MQGHFILFSINTTRYCIETKYVQEIIELPEIRQIPELPPYIIGVVNLYGDIIQVIDLAMCLDHEPSSYNLDHVLLIVHHQGIRYGFIILNLIDITTITYDKSFALDMFAGEHACLFPMISEVIKFQHEITFVLDPPLIYKSMQEHTSTEPKLLQSGNGNRFKVPEHSISIFQDRSQRLLQPLKESRLINPIPIAVVSLQGELYGIEPDPIVEVCNIAPLTFVPFSVPQVLGLMNLRGAIVLILSLWVLLNKKTPVGQGTTTNSKALVNPNAKVLLLKHEENILGLLIDEILDVVSLEAADFRPIPNTVKSVSAEFIKSAIRYADDLLPILNIEEILASLAVHSNDK